MNILSLVSILGNVALIVLQNAGIAPAGTTALATALETAIQPLLAKLSSGGNTASSDVLAALGALSGVLQVLKSQTNLPANVLSEIEAHATAVQAALAAEVATAKGIDLSALAPVTPIQ